MKKLVKTKPSKQKEPKEKAKLSTINHPSFLVTRFRVVLGILALGAVALFLKSVYLQIDDSERLIKEANKRSLRASELPFTRGKILDRNGRMLSTSVPMYSVTIDPKEYFDTQLRRNKARWRKLSFEMGGSSSKIEASVNKFIKSKRAENSKQKKYDPRALFNIDSDDYWHLLALATGLDYSDLIVKVRNNPNSAFVQAESDAISLEIQKMKALASSVGIKYNDLMDKLYKASEQRFLYIARHQSEVTADYIVGKIDEKGEKVKAHQGLHIDAIMLKKETRRVYPLAEEVAQLIGFTDQDNRNGAEGLERSFNSLLIGKNGKQVIRKNAKGEIIERIRDEKQYDPQDVMLSIDEELQSMAYREIKKAVIDNKAESGTAVLLDIHTGEILAMANAPSYNPNNRSDFKPELARNRAITDTFEPGSTVKPLVVLTALQNKATYLGEVINTRSFIVNGFPIKDVAPRESLTLTGILQKSSNVGVSRLALRMPSTALMETYTKVGFGKDTGLGLGEVKGTNGDRKIWSDIERATVAYGYGLTVTPLQLARAYATLGSFGIYRPLSVTKVDPPVIGERVLPEKITRDVVHMMESVAQKGEGGQKAAVDGFRVAIKTGTARKLEKGRYVEKYIAYTAGIAPASDPRFALVVLINEPKAGAYYGGAVSAPLFSKIMGYTLKTYNIRPDNLGTDNHNAVREINH
ncbi:cell division protein FtsI [Vespertiliibacter pulmonis]|uniref:Peptidoglycan synthetase FtsI n=1 Tax=Vespertiliibacter pulmonis TaxID=1443036 RepID=A0A3N4WA57_9PAST|nr:penicillin-binding transpeptidase domain-containing protein [Vespertiliibacter pulmonis]QLB20428.1 cell division protein FtsI [Vespertiliibacter pulmonis]RPE86417.1 peptidoglycan synthetase FtsI [Vespertiliibacter pulmonis]